MCEELSTAVARTSPSIEVLRNRFRNCVPERPKARGYGEPIVLAIDSDCIFAPAKVCADLLGSLRRPQCRFEVKIEIVEKASQ